MILIGILKQQQNHIWHLYSSSLLRSTNILSSLNLNRFLNYNHQYIENQRSLLSVRLPIIINQPFRTRKLKFSFGYTNYGHRRHVRPPGHHVVHYMQFFLVIIGAYAMFYLTGLATMDISCFTF
ncbi:unnamed protein product [Rotaria sordida]|uniref:Uncharacterized protein n=1 Tax=Rotaria sordida TaxID=392033 RepID=A0A814FN02_9BILA|nr:unnamed protein product [Rotaria sordida]